MPSNAAAWLTEFGKPLVVKEAPYPSTPGEHDLVIAVHNLAINPVDYVMAQRGTKLFPGLTAPMILGHDVAGEVVAVGSAVTRFRVGDRVSGQTPAGFQKYAVVADHQATHLPASVSYEQACVTPLTFSTACMGLFHKDLLGLRLPPTPPPPSSPDKAQTETETETGRDERETVLIWGGSTSVGSNAIQLAVAAGYEVYTTASARNFAYVRGLGAHRVFDYSSPAIGDELAAAFQGKISAGALANGGPGGPSAHEGIVAACAAAILHAKGGSNFVALTMVPPAKLPESGVRTRFCRAMGSAEVELGYSLYGEYLSRALAAGTFTLAPRAEVVGRGLEAVQAAMEKCMGMSAAKMVVSLE